MGALFCSASVLLAQQPRSVDSVLEMYLHAIGGQQAIDSIRTREILGTVHGNGDAFAILEGEKSALQTIRAKVTCYWKAPDLAVDIQKLPSGGTSVVGFDGSGLWIISTHLKHPRRRSDHELREELEVTANPLRYVRIKTLYPTVQASSPEKRDSKAMDVLEAPNGSGATKFYFDVRTHLLTYIREIGISAAYYPSVIKLADYKRVDGVEFPFRMAFTSPEPDAPTHEIRISSVKQNIPIDPDQFKRSSIKP
jgi:hypothetical protein